MEGAKPIDAIETSADECAFWLYSFGLNRPPERRAACAWRKLKSTADTPRCAGVGDKGKMIRSYSAAKIFFAYGLGNAMTFPMSVGATTVLFSGRPTPEAVLDTIARENVTIFCGVPTLYAATVSHLENQRSSRSQAAALYFSGEALPAEIGNKWQALIGTEIPDGVGSTEMLHIFLSNRPGHVRYMGRPDPQFPDMNCDVSMRTVCERHRCRGRTSGTGRFLQQMDIGTRGTKAVRLLKERDPNGDKYEIAENGLYVYCGRTDDMFKVSGIWLSPFEVEQALISHSAILEAAVVAATDDDGFEKPKAFVVLKNPSEPVEPNALKEFVKDKIGKWKYPRWIEVVEDLPKTATGKIQRFKLRDPA